VRVTSEYRKLRKVVLCKPDYYRWLPINEPAAKVMREGQTFELGEAKKQHREFSETLSSTGVEVLYVECRKDRHYQVYTRDVGITTKGGVLLGKFREPARKGEEDFAEEVFVKEGIPIVGRVSAGSLEGGDVHYVDDETLAIGVGARSTIEGITEAEVIFKRLGLTVIPVEFPEEYLHLDLLFVVIGERMCVACTEMLPRSFIVVLKDKKFSILEVSKEEAIALKTNVLSLDEKTVLSFRENWRLNAELEALGFEVLKPEINIFTRGGGGPRCLTFPLERE
jgi:N-dimethylarginine dimethylaminohydrolase